MTPPPAQPHLAVLGAGINGITTALLLHLLGYRTTIYTAHRADDPAARGNPAFASLYPAASVMPHSVTIRDLHRHLRTSHAFFACLHQQGGCGVRKQRNYEVFEEPVALPPYAACMEAFEKLPPDGSGGDGVPRRRGAPAVYGWHFTCFFAEMPVYLPRLYALYETTGGVIRQQRITREALARLSADAIVNCTGLWTHELFDDPKPSTVLRGHLVHVAVPKQPVHPQTGAVFSYNYQPIRSVYATAQGQPADVYCYPRRDGWILGGSRDPGRLRPGDSWRGDTAAQPTFTIGGHVVPEPILTLNRQLMLDLTGIDLAPYRKRAMIGYRFARDLAGEGVRLEVEQTANVPVVHNYGHGGAGVTLSWGCSLTVARLLTAEVGLRPPRAIAPPAGPDQPLRQALYDVARQQLD